MYTLPPASHEQNSIIEALKEGMNVITNSVAGSGKTTTIMHVAKTFNEHYSNTKILVLTYNRRLRDETVERAKKTNVPLDIYTYHGFCVRYLSSECHNDTGIEKSINKNWRQILLDWNLIVIDEVQDMNPLYYRLVRKIVAGYPMIQYCIIGDDKQSIYDFNNADPRFILLADKLYTSSRDWKRLTLSTSYRVNDKNAYFVNKCLLGYDKIIPVKKSNFLPRYIICDAFGTRSRTGQIGLHDAFEELQYYYKCGYNNGDIFILAPSIKSNASPVIQFANFISQRGIPIHVPKSDEEKLDESILKNKLVFSTFHQVKGLERKVVLIFGFDAGYFKFYKRDGIQDSCPNEIYVATTRASERMTVFHHYQNNFLPFLKQQYIEQTCEVIMKRRVVIPRESDRSPPPVSVTNYCRHIPHDIIDLISRNLPSVEIKPEGSKIKIQSHVKCDYSSCITADAFLEALIEEDRINANNKVELTESISHITGIAIPMYYQYITTEKIRYVTDLLCDRTTQYFLRPTYGEKSGNITIPELISIALKHDAVISQYIFQVNQVTNLNWLTEKILIKTSKRIKEIVGEGLNVNFEEHMSTMTLHGFIDCIDYERNILWEFKCVNSITNDHLIQAALYKYLCIHSASNNELREKAVNMKCFVFNILSGQVIEIISNPEQLESIYNIIHDYKSRTKNSISDEEFIRQMLSY